MRERVEREGEGEEEGERERRREGEGEQEGVEVREGHASKDLAAGLVSSSTEGCLVTAKGFTSDVTALMLHRCLSM